MSSTFSHTYNTTTSGTGPAGYVDYNGDGADSLVSKEVHVIQGYVDQNDIRIARTEGGSNIKVLVKAPKDVWGDIPLTSNTMFNAVASARINAPAVVPTIVHGALIHEYKTKAIGERTWEVTVVYQTTKPGDPGGDEATENPDNHEMGEVTRTFKGTSSLQSINLPKGQDYYNSLGLYNQDIYKDARFKKSANGFTQPTTVSVQTPVQQFQIERIYDAGFITQAYLKTINELTGELNDDVWMTYDARTVRFEGADYSFDEFNKEVITYKFAVRKAPPAETFDLWTHINLQKQARAIMAAAPDDDIIGHLLGPAGSGLRTSSTITMTSGWDYVQYAYATISGAENSAAADRTRATSVIIGAQVIKVYPDGDFSDLALAIS